MIYKPLSRAERIGSQGADNRFWEQAKFFRPALDRRLRLRNLSRETVEAGQTPVETIGDEARLGLLREVLLNSLLPTHEPDGFRRPKLGQR